MTVLKRLLILTTLCISATVHGQDESELLVVADEALARISEEDSAGLAALMIPEAMVYIGSENDDGSYRVSTRTYESTRDRSFEVDLVERGWDPTVMVSGTIGIVWYPYDIYVDGEWSHCGIDIFNMIRTNDGWRIAAMQFNVQQPPDCSPHPEGPPIQ